MKIVEKSKVKKQKIKKNSSAKPKKEHVLIVAQEIKFARLLAGNEQKSRDRALKSLKKWLLNCFQREYEFKEADFARIWKGLFYAVWMSDKPLVQEELCDSIASLLDIFPVERLSSAILLTRVGLQVLAKQWYGLDTHRIDKFLMLVRRFLRGSLRVLHRCDWSRNASTEYADMLAQGPLALQTPVYARNATSLVLHFVDCFLEEVAKVSQGSISPSSLSILLRPFISYMCSGDNQSIATSCRRMLNYLVRQSEQGIEYAERTKAWEQMGCPAGGPEALELDVDSDDEGTRDDDDDEDTEPSEPPLDPRAGHVDVVLQTLPVPCEQIVQMLQTMLTSLGSKAHKRAKICLQRFQQLSSNQYPLPVQPPIDVADTKTPGVQQRARKLKRMERALVKQADELNIRGLSRRHRKRLLAKSRAGLSIIDDVKTGTTNGEWQVEDTEPLAKKAKKENIEKQKKTDHDKENQSKNKRQDVEKQNGDAKNKKMYKQTVQTDKKDKVLKKQKNATNVTNPDTTMKNAKIASSKSIIKVKNNKKLEAKMTNGNAKPKNSLAAIKQKIENKNSNKEIKNKKDSKLIEKDSKKSPTITAKRVKNFQKQLSPKIPAKQSPKAEKNDSNTPKKVKFVLKNNSMQGPVDYYKSVRQSPSIPFDSKKQPSKTNLKVSTPSPINPFFKKKFKMNK